MNLMREGGTEIRVSSNWIIGRSAFSFPRDPRYYEAAFEKRAIESIVIDWRPVVRYAQNRNIKAFSST